MLLGAAPACVLFLPAKLKADYCGAGAWLLRSAGRSRALLGYARLGVLSLALIGNSLVTEAVNEFRGEPGAEGCEGRTQPAPSGQTSPGVSTLL